MTRVVFFKRGISDSFTQAKRFTFSLKDDHEGF
ncbi:hypothetical protein L905_05405 [Agrobacterium sp. TS43]|uniref:Uncharacterized protein n=3 Tax=Agrobacterium TaxID=357 RepID=A0A1S7Q7C0_9HYPH|nr:hypothetical protein ATCR1_03884 [Agrobacterium tumefaciens CCNWGS0286]KJX89429.1 hypothetical protein SY94_0463 [Agrobacterium tumefaciens]KVK41436.1 hypothetical protein L901_10975 [Agrobacterium sp. D14]KVK52210.1 hypothetical protein L903_02370 [Agrobacterium sp. JL28]KVK53195.1 hypothetical protein L904_02535 [Agrobacterium sp. LY4]KVK64553.1 hypothetical protein L906_02355 [Agrobacterium sp. TS45]KVK65292.1 hypothetical protein L905_05405 [Agrobacterium sp. TS43]KVK68783.1 hypotheti